jgi:2-oxoglutarate ferredoxin oxidoreductase subunit delta
MAKSKGQTEIIIFPDWCKGCAICVSFCPAKVLALNEAGKSSVVALEECINCGFCELHCPDFAIMVRPSQAHNRRKNDVKPSESASAPAPDAAIDAAAGDPSNGNDPKS